MIGNLELVNTNFTLYDKYEKHKYYTSCDIIVGNSESNIITFGIYVKDITDNEEFYEFTLNIK
jgi:hypothetical protein